MTDTKEIATVPILTDMQIVELRDMLLPLTMQWRISGAMVHGYLAGIGLKGCDFNIDLPTGTVSLIVKAPATSLDKNGTGGTG